MPLPKLDPADYQDLRLAVVMNGGVSLAVWIGGVTMELNRFEKPSGIYAEILDLMATRLQTDVICGTSAGGVNGGFLAAARAYGSDLAPLRELWIEKGAVEKLLHPAGVKEPQALLDGEYFLDELKKAFQMLTRGAPTKAAEYPVDLTLTTTLLHGVPNTLVDDFGTPIADSNHRARFRFRRDQDSDDFATQKIAEQLALAARATASFPIAFEPQFAEVFDGALANRICSFRSNRYLIDGGLLDNKPLDHAIEAVRSQREQGEVRRVLCYVVPSPETPVTNDPDLKDAPPTVFEVGVASLAGIPLAQSISGQLQQITDHNRLVREVRSTRHAIASLGWTQVDAIAAQAFKSYKFRRIVSLANYLADEVCEGIALRQSGPAVGRRRKEWIVNLFIEELQQTTTLPWVPAKRPSKGQDLPKADAWNWGVFTTENIANTVLYLLRQGVRLLSEYSEPQQTEHDAKGVFREKLRLANDEYLKVTRSREGSHSLWRDQGKSLQFDAESGRKWVRDCFAQGQGFSASAGNSAHAFAKLLAEAAESLQTVANRNTNSPGATGFSDLVKLLVFDQAALTADRILERLLNLEVVQFGFGVSSVVRGLADQVLELAEISADNSAEIAVGLSAGKRPLGAQVAAFGGFYKRSWRAFDWTLGRLHGIERILRIVLAPERLAKLCRVISADQRKAAVIAELERLALPASGPDREACLAQWTKQRLDVEREIDSLLKADVVPEQLPCTVKALLYRCELAILREEIPKLAIAVQQDIGEGHSPRLAREFLDTFEMMIKKLPASATPTGETLGFLWANCRIDDETFEAEMETDRFIATVSQASVVGSTLLGSEHSGLGPVSTIFSVLRWPARLAHVLALRLITESKSGVALFVFVMAISLTVACLPFFGHKISVPTVWRWAAGGITVLAIVLFVLVSPMRKKVRSGWAKVRNFFGTEKPPAAAGVQ